MTAEERAHEDEYRQIEQVAQTVVEYDEQAGIDGGAGKNVP